MAVVVLALLIALAMFSALLVAQNANAQASYTTCYACHTSAKHSSNPTHAGLYSGGSCASCHADGFAAANKGVTPKACGKCHGGVTAILASNQHKTNGCGTTVGCHGYTSPTPTPTPTPTATAVRTVMTAKAAPTTVKVGKTVTISGTATPIAQLAGAKIAILVNRKVGTKWVKAKAATAKASAKGAYSWKYKVLKKGSYQVKVSVKATPTFTAKSVTKTFKAK